MSNVGDTAVILGLIPHLIGRYLPAVPAVLTMGPLAFARTNVSTPATSSTAHLTLTPAPAGKPSVHNNNATAVGVPIVSTPVVPLR